jgi:hypothetical protein
MKKAITAVLGRTTCTQPMLPQVRANEDGIR